jgi:hypothetical protein
MDKALTEVVTASTSTKPKEILSIKKSPLALRRIGYPTSSHDFMQFSLGNLWLIY